MRAESVGSATMSETTRSAGGQLEQPCEVKTSRRTGPDGRRSARAGPVHAVRTRRRARLLVGVRRRGARRYGGAGPEFWYDGSPVAPRGVRVDGRPFRRLGARWRRGKAGVGPRVAAHPTVGVRGGARAGR